MLNIKRHLSLRIFKNITTYHSDDGTIIPFFFFFSGVDSEYPDRRGTRPFETVRQDIIGHYRSVVIDSTWAFIIIAPIAGAN